MSSGFCFVTFAEHAAPVTAVAFLPSSSAAVSASLDGTVRAWDLLRYRNFRTLTTPSPVQFASLAVDPRRRGGEVAHLPEHPKPPPCACCGFSKYGAISGAFRRRNVVLACWVGSTKGASDHHLSHLKPLKRLVILGRSAGEIHDR